MSQREPRREFRLQDGKSDKFWAIALDGKAYTVQYGRTGTRGRTQTKELASPAAARAAYDKLIAEKTKKGYAELAAGGAAPASSAPPQASSEAEPTPREGGADDAARAVAGPEARDEERAAAPGSTPAGPRAQPAPRAGCERRLGLAPEDYLFATWRRTPARPLPTPRPFDRADCLARLRQVAPEGYAWRWDWSPARLAVDASPEEAAFWLHAIAEAHPDKQPAALAAELEQRELEPAGLETVRRAFKLERAAPHRPGTTLTATGMVAAPDTLAPIVALLGPTQAAEWALEQLSIGPTEGLLEGFRRFVLPYLEPAAREALAERLKPQLDPTTFPQDLQTRPAGAFHLAALLGAPDTLLALVESWPDDRYDPARHGGWQVDIYHAPQRVIFGLGSPDLVVHHLRRLQLPLRSATHLHAFLAHTELSDLEWAARAVAKETDKQEAAALMAALSAVEAPELAPVMLDLLGSKAPKQAREWLDVHRDHVAFGLVELAAGRGKRAAAALEELRRLGRQGHEALLREAAAAAAPEVARRITAEVLERREQTYPPLTDDLPDWLRAGLAAAAALKRVEPPGWVAPADLPPLVLGERRLADEHVTQLLRALQKAPLSAPAAAQPLIAGLRAHAEPRSRGAFAWRLFERWLSEGAPSKEKWALAAVGHLGDDVCALELAPLIRAWPGESQHPRAVLGLEVLRAIGSDTALMQINGIATKLKYKGLKARATACMEAIAEARGMSRAELEDRIVPDCGLEADGSRVFDFGPRRFTFALGPDLKPLVRDAQGKLKKALPKPGVKDDPVLAAAALEAWGLLKKQLRDVLKIQPERLEQAMVTGRRWKAADFERLLVHHPLMTHLVRLLLWGDYPAGGGAPRPFRVSEERELLDPDDEPFEPTGEVGLVHPLELDAATRARWGEVFADYQLLSPFPQLGREVHRIEPQEANETRLVRLAGRKIAAMTLVGTLERLGWTRGTPQDAGVVHEHSKPFGGADVTAVLQYETGVPVGYMADWEDQEVTGVVFLAGLKSADACSWIRPGEAVALGDVAPIALSEVLRDLGVLEGKAR